MGMTRNFFKHYQTCLPIILYSIQLAKIQNLISLTTAIFHKLLLIGVFDIRQPHLVYTIKWRKFNRNFFYISIYAVQRNFTTEFHAVRM